METPLNLVDLALHGHLLPLLGSLAVLLLFLRKEDPIKKLHGHLDVVLKLPLGQLVPAEACHGEDVLLTARGQYLHHLLALLHPDDRAIVKDRLDTEIGVGDELGEASDLHLAHHFARARHRLDHELAVLEALLNGRCSSWLLIYATPLVEHIILHQLESVDQNFLQVNRFLAVLLMRHLL